jgi:hypothetical protein
MPKKIEKFEHQKSVQKIRVVSNKAAVHLNQALQKVLKKVQPVQAGVQVVEMEIKAKMETVKIKLTPHLI